MKNQLKGIALIIFAVLTVGDLNEPIKVDMKGGTADYYSGSADSKSNTLIWNENDVLFCITAHLSCEELVEIAESVEN